jgi:hypothetical protein
MKTFYAIVLLAFVGLAILGCSESTDQLVAPVEKASTVSLEKGPVVHSVTGNANIWIYEKMGVLTINAHQYADETVKGNMHLVTTALNPKGEKVHYEVVALKIYPDFEDGNAALFWARVISVSNPDYEWMMGKLFVSFLVDNGEGANATAPDMCGGILGPFDSIDMNITPEDIVDALPDWYVPIAVGNVAIH